MSFVVVEHNPSNKKRPIDLTMPPPRKVYRVGSQECMEAMRRKTLELSLPEYQQASGMDSFPSRAGIGSSTILVQKQLIKPKDCLVVLDGSDDERDDELEEDKNNSNSKLKDDGSVAETKEDGVEDRFHSKAHHLDSSSQKLHEKEEDEEEDDMSESNERPLLDSMVVISQEESSVLANASCSPSSSVACSANTAPPKFQEPDPTLPRFSDIIGHGAVKLRIEEVLLPIALPDAIAQSVLTGTFGAFVLKCMIAATKNDHGIGSTLISARSYSHFLNANRSPRVGIRSMPASILFYGPPGVGEFDAMRRTLRVMTIPCVCLSLPSVCLTRQNKTSPCHRWRGGSRFSLRGTQ